MKTQIKHENRNSISNKCAKELFRTKISMRIFGTNIKTFSNFAQLKKHYLCQVISPLQ